MPSSRDVDAVVKAIYAAIPIALLAGVAFGLGWWILGLLLAAFPALVFVQLWRGK